MATMIVDGSKSLAQNLISVNPEKDVCAWMQNNLDGSHHPALNTDVAKYDGDRQAWTLLSEEAKPDLYVFHTNIAHDR